MPSAFAPSEKFTDEEFVELRRRLMGAVRKVCPRWLANELEDIVQEVLIKLLRRLRAQAASKEPSQESTTENEDTPAFSRSYLMKAAYHQVVDEIRHRRVRREVPMETEEGDLHPVPDQRPGPSQEDRSRRLGRAILDCLRQLLDSRRRAVTLYLRGHSAKEAAKLLGWGVKRTENLIYRGREDLQSCLQGAGFRSED